MLSNEMCDPECNNAECMWDFGYCVRINQQEECAPSCTNEMLGNNYCDVGCNIADCEYDHDICNCRQDFFQCDTTDLTLACRYGNYGQPDGCADEFDVRTVLYTQILQQNFFAVINFNGPLYCDKLLRKESFISGECISACNNEAALFSMGMCAKNLPPHCMIGWGPADDECFQCDTLQYFGRCVDECPSGTETITVFSQMCANLTSVSTKDSPDRLYVREDTRAVAIREGPLFFRFLDALAAAWEVYTMIFLVGSEVTFDISIADSARNIDYLTVWAFPDIFASGRWLELTIESLPCSVEERPGCSQGSTTLLLQRVPTTFLTSRRLIFRDVIFTTRSYFFFDTVQACFVANSEKTLGDTSFALRKCAQFADFTLFVVGTSGALTLEVSTTQHVRFEDMTLRFKSIITIASGVLRLIDTHFKNVHTTDAVILQMTDCLSLGKSCGSVSYKGGTVVYLNNWREFGMGFSPFLSAHFLHSLHITGVQFELCFASVALLSVRDSKEFVITDCVFRSNVVFGSLLSIDSTTAIETLPFQVSNSTFALNYSKGPLLLLSFRNVPRTVNFNGCIFEGNAGEAAILVTFGGVFTSNSSVSVLRTVFFSNSAFRELLKVQNFGTVSMSRAEFRDNGSQQESVLKYFIDDPGTLASNPPTPSQVKCTSLIMLQQCSFSLFENITVTGNCCDGGGTGIVYQGINEQQLVLTIALFARNVGTGTTATALHLFEGTRAEVRNLTAEDNTQTGAGVISLQANVQLLVLDSLFQRNRGEEKSCISSLGALDIKVLRCHFSGNEALLGDGAAIALSASQPQAPLLTLEVRDSTFFGNHAQRGSSIGVFAQITKITVTLRLVNSTFLNNRASLAGSSLYLDSDSCVSAVIEGCEFAYEESESGAINLQQNLGTINISRSVFKFNGGRDCSALCIDSGPLSIVRLEEIELTDNENSVIAKLNQQVKSRLETHLCFFQRNPTAANLHNTEWKDSFSVFHKSTSTAIILSSCAATLIGTKFEDNESPLYGGALSLSESDLQCTECVFRGNAAAKGAAIFEVRQSFLLLLSCLLAGNIASDEGAAVFAHSSSFTANSSIFLENVAGMSGTVTAIGSLVALHQSDFADNTAPLAPGISLILDSIASIDECTFRNQTGDEAAFFVLQISSSATVSNCTFSSGSGRSAGGAFVSLSTLSISNSIFTNMQAESGGVIYAASDALVILIGVTVTKAHSQLGAIVHIRSGRLVLQKCRFFEYEIDAVNAEGVKSIEIRQSVFEGGRGNAVRCIECSNVTIAGTSFEFNRGVTGALFLQSTTGSLVLVSDCLFIGNSADQGGAVFGNSVDLRITGCNFIENSALYGGALYHVCNYSGLCGLSVSHSAFERNTAEMSGGAVQWLHVPPLFFNVTYRENKAQCGPDLSSFLANVHLFANDSGDFLSIIHEVTPGELGAVTLVAILHDHYDQLQVLDSSTSCRVRAQNESIATLAGVTTARAVHGVVTFADLIIYAKPKSSVILEVYECNGKLISYSSRLEVRLRNCRPGETASHRMCEPCGNNSYSLDSSKPCQSCPNHCTCLGKTNIIPDPGYWLSAQISVNVRKCRNPSACAGGREMTSICAAGYENHLCQVCSNGYYSPGNFRCIECPSAAIAQGLFVTLAALLAISLLVWTSVKVPNAAPCLRVLVNFFQTLYFAAELDIEWPRAVSGLLQAVRVVVAPFYVAVPFDCWLSTDSAYFSKLIIFVMLPVTVALALALLWLPVFAAARNLPLFLKYSAKAIVVIYFFVYPTLMISSFSVLSCTEIEAGEFWLSHDIRSRCWTTKHLTYAVAVGVMNLFLWVAMQPFLHREGFFTQGLTEMWRNWEAAGLLRKAAMAAVSVLFVDKIKARVLTLQLLVWTALVAHFLYWPFASWRLNQLEFLSLLISAITLWCGILYLSAASASWLVQVVVVACVSVFPVVWLRELRTALKKHEDSLETLAGKMSRPAKKLECVDMKSLYLLLLQTGIRDVPDLSRWEGVASKKSRKVFPIS